MRYAPLSEVMLVKSLFLCPSNRWRSRDLENKIPRSSEVYMVPKNVSGIKKKGKKGQMLVSRNVSTLISNYRTVQKSHFFIFCYETYVYVQTSMEIQHMRQKNRVEKPVFELCSVGFLVLE